MKPTKGIVVDGACSGNPGVGEYRIFDIATGKILFASQQFEDSTNNQMEFLGLVHALALLSKQRRSETVYSDSQTARAWVRDCKNGSSHATTNETLKEQLNRAVNWLRENRNHCPVEVWRTREWGENNADYGRKAVYAR